MNRVDQLTLKFADNALSDDEAVELLTLVENDCAAREQHERLLQVEFALREELSLEALRHKVMASVDTEHCSEFTERTMTQIRTMPSPRRRRKAPVPIAGIFAMAAALALMLTVAYFLLNAKPASTATDAFLTAEAGNAVILRGEQLIEVTGKAPLHASDKIEVSGNATINYSQESTKLLLHEGAKLTVLEPALGKRYLLTYGEIVADVAPQPTGKPLVIDTPTASTTVIGTVFQLSYLAQKSVLSVTKGAVEILASNGEKALVDAGRMAEYLDGQPLSERWINEPSGLVSRFTFDDFDERRLLDPSGAVVAKLARPPILTDGMQGSALHLDGEQQFVEIPHLPDYALDNGSISFWLRADRPHKPSRQMLLTKRKRVDNQEDAHGYMYIDINEQGRIHAQLYGQSGEEYMVTSQHEIQADTWQLVTLNFGSLGMQLFIDAQLEEHVDTPVTLTPNRQSIILGGDNFFNTRRLKNMFSGQLDDLRIYNRPLSEAEIRQLAQGR